MTTNQNHGNAELLATRNGDGPRRSDGKRGGTAAAHIYQCLRADILAMRIKPGTAIIEKKIALSFGVSRTPVREAVLRLADERLIEVFPQSGTFVAPIPVDEMPEALVIRRALEETATRHAALNITAEGEAALWTCVQDQRAAAARLDFEAFHEGDETFHALISEIAGYPGIWEVIRQTKVNIDRYRRLTLPEPGRMAAVIAEHEAVVKSIANRSPDDAARAMDTHLDHLKSSLSETRAAHPAYFSGVIGHLNAAD